jgi:predicted exporter
MTRFWQSLKARAIAGGVLMLLIAAASFATFVSKSPLQTDLLALLPATERNARAEEAVNQLAATTGNRVIFLVGHVNADTARTAASRMAKGLQGSSVFQNAMAELPPIDLAQLMQLYRTHRYFLLTPADREALGGASAKGSAQGFDGKARIEAKLLRPNMGGLALPLTEDPWGLTDAWLDQLPLKTMLLEPEQGFLSTQAKGVTWVLVSAQLKGSAFDYGVQQQAVMDVNAAASVGAQVQVLRLGAVFYAHAARTSAEREIDIIGVGSALGALLLLYLVFRSIKPLLLGLVTVAAGVAAAATVSVWTWGSIHVMTLVFGASLIGEAIDYAVQYFAAHLGYGNNANRASWDPLAGLRKITPGLAIALATSALGYAALSLAPFPALKQIALFALVGLGTACLLVFLWLPFWLKKPSQRDPEVAVAIPKRLLAWWQQRMTWKPALVVALAALLLAAPGWWRLSSNDDVRLLINKPADLAAQEMQIRTLAG